MTNLDTMITQFNEQAAAGSNYISVEPQVAGFWGSPITLRVKRGWGDEPQWAVEVTHSSGGYEGSDKGIPQLQQERNFALGLLAVLDFAETLPARFEEFEAAYQARMEAWRAEAAAERAAKQAAIDADPAIGVGPARAYLEALKAAVKVEGSQPIRVLRAKARGSADVAEFVVLRNWSGTVLIRFCGSSVSLKDAAGRLGNMAFAGLVPDAPLTDEELMAYRRNYL